MGIVGNAVLKAIIGREIHIAWVANGCTIYDEAVFKGLEDIISEGGVPHTVGVAFHRDVLRQHLAEQFYLLGFWGLEAEVDAFGSVFR